MDQATAVGTPPTLAADRVGLVPAVAAAVAAWAGVGVTLLAVVRDADRGVDAMDESHYLLAAQPWAASSGFDGIFGWYLGRLLRLVGNDVARLRLLGAAVLVVAALLAAHAVRAACERIGGDRWPLWLRVTWPAAVVSGSLCFYVVYVRTPAYNWFAEVGLLALTAGVAGFVAPAASGRRALAVAAVPLGAGLWITAIGKATSAAGAVAVVAVVAAVLPRLRRTPPRWVVTVLAATAGVLLVGLVLHLVFVNGLGTTLTALQRAAGAVASVDPVRYTPGGVVEAAVHGVWNVLAGSPGPLTIWGLLPLLALLATGGPDDSRQRVLLGLTVPGMVLPVLLTLHGFPGGVPGLSSAAAPLVLAAETALAAALVAVSWRAGALPGPDVGPESGSVPGADPRLVLLGVAVAGLGLCVPLGTNVEYATQTPAAGGLFVCAAATLLAVTPPRVRLPSVGCLVAASVLLAAVAVPTSRAQAPYRLQPLAQQVIPRSLVPGTPPLLVDVSTAAWIDDLRTNAVRAGWQRGTPLLDLTWHPMSVLVLDGRAPKTLLPAFPGWGSEARSAAYALQQEDPRVWRRAWILVPTGQPTATTDAATQVVGRAFPGDYVLVARVTAPFDGQQQDLWRPRNLG